MRAPVRSSRTATSTVGVSGSGNQPDWTQTGPFVSTGIGTDHYCALAPGGAVSCWGNNGYGRATVPAGLSGITQVTAGKFQTCALTSAGAADCWGAIYGSNLGSPADDSAGPYSQISAGDEHNCGVTVSGNVVCWGYDSGYGETAGQTAPDGDPYVQVSAGGSHNCALRSSGAIDCWGSSSSGKSTPPTDGPFTQVDAGHTIRARCARTAPRSAGGRITRGETIVPAGEHFVQLSAGEFRSCGLRVDGSVLCWGRRATAPTTRRPARTGCTLSRQASPY